MEVLNTPVFYTNFGWVIAWTVVSKIIKDFSSKRKINMETVVGIAIWMIVAVSPIYFMLYFAIELLGYNLSLAPALIVLADIVSVFVSKIPFVKEKFGFAEHPDILYQTLVFYSVLIVPLSLFFIILLILLIISSNL